MKCYTYINEQEEEKVLIYAKERTKLVEDIESLALMDDVELTGTCNEEIVKIDIKQVSCFISENNKVFALIGEKKYQIRQRLYQIEEMNINTFIKLNQSCLANKNKITILFQLSRIIFNQCPKLRATQSSICSVF